MSDQNGQQTQSAKTEDAKDDELSDESLDAVSGGTAGLMQQTPQSQMNQMQAAKGIVTQGTTAPATNTFGQKTGG